MDGSAPSSDGMIDVARVAPTAPSLDEREALRAMLSLPLPSIPPRYFYDDVGSELFEKITALSVYYQTRTEISILERFAGDIMQVARPRHVVELGSGAGRKIRLLLDAWGASAEGGTCTMLDINELFLRQSLERLGADYTGLRFRGVVGDFVQDLDRLGAPGGRLIVFFAGTIGNLDPSGRRAFLRALAGTMDETDRFVVGIDLVKDPRRLEAAYDDPEGVTAAFNRNMLSVVNRRFEGDFAPDLFDHKAIYDVENAWIEMRLVARRACEVHLGALDMRLDFEPGSQIRTEISCKFTRASLAATVLEAGLEIEGWYSDPEELFALALLRKGAS